jgi:hypothetical protein
MTTTATRHHQFEYACVWIDCPECGQHRDFVHIGRGHWGYCPDCRCMWMFGSNLFSSWRDESEAEQRARYDDLGLGEYRTATAGLHPSTQAAYEASEFATAGSDIPCDVCGNCCTNDVCGSEGCTC